MIFLFLNPLKNITTFTHFYLFNFSLRIILWLNYFLPLAFRGQLRQLGGNVKLAASLFLGPIQ